MIPALEEGNASEMNSKKESKAALHENKRIQNKMLVFDFVGNDKGSDNVTAGFEELSGKSRKKRGATLDVSPVHVNSKVLATNNRDKSSGLLLSLSSIAGFLKMKKKQNDEKLFSVDDRMEETLLPEGNPDDNTVIVSASSLLFMELDVLNRFVKK